MPHIPSVAVGSAVVLSGYVLLHRELTHRKRQTNQWARTKEKYSQICAPLRKNQREGAGLLTVRENQEEVISAREPRNNIR